VQILINFDTNYGIRKIVASIYISEDELKMEEVTTSSETTSNTKDYLAHENFVL